MSTVLQGRQAVSNYQLAISPTEREKYLQAANNLIEALRLFQSLLTNDSHFGLLLIAKNTFQDHWEQLYNRLEGLYNGEWSSLISKEGEDFGFSTLTTSHYAHSANSHFVNVASFATSVADGFHKLWSSVFKFFTQININAGVVNYHPEVHSKLTVQLSSQSDYFYGGSLSSINPDNDYRPPLSLAYLVEDEIITVGFKTLKSLSRRLEGVRACMGNINDVTFCCELLAAALRGVYRRKKGTREWTKALNLVLYKVPALLKMWQNDELRERSTRTFLDNIPRSVLSNVKSINEAANSSSLGLNRTAGASQEESVPPLTSPSEGSYLQTPTMLTTPSPGPGSINFSQTEYGSMTPGISSQNMDGDYNVSYNYIEQSIIHLASFPALLQIGASGTASEATLEKESASLLNDVANACIYRGLVSPEKIQSGFQKHAPFSYQPLVTMQTVAIPLPDGAKPSSVADIHYLIANIENPANPREVIHSCLKCLVNGINHSWQIRDELVASILCLLQKSSELSPLTISDLFQSFCEMHCNLELLGDDLPQFIKLTIEICNWFGVGGQIEGKPPIRGEGDEKAHKLFSSSFLLLAHFTELCDMKSPANYKNRAIMRDILLSINSPPTYSFTNWFCEHIGSAVDSGATDVTQCGDTILSLLFDKPEEAKALLEANLDSITPWQAIQSMPYLISRVYSDLISSTLNVKALLEGLKLLMNQVRYCIVPLVSFLWNDVTTRSWDLQTGKPFAWGIMKALIPELPVYVKDSIQIQRTKIIALFPNEAQKAPSCVYRDTFKPTHSLGSIMLESFQSISDRVVLSPLANIDFKSILEKAGKRNFCDLLIKAVMKTTEHNTLAVGPYATHSLRSAELAACILVSYGGTSAISHFLLEVLPLWTANISSHYIAQTLAQFTNIAILYGIYPNQLLGVDTEEIKLTLTHFMLWFTENLEKLTQEFPANTPFFLTVASTILGFRSIVEYAPTRRLAAALKALGCSELAYSLFNLQSENDMAEFYRFIKQNSAVNLFRS